MKLWEITFSRRCTERAVKFITARDADEADEKARKLALMEEDGKSDEPMLWEVGDWEGEIDVESVREREVSRVTSQDIIK